MSIPLIINIKDNLYVFFFTQSGEGDLNLGCSWKVYGYYLRFISKNNLFEIWHTCSNLIILTTEKKKRKTKKHKSKI